MSSQEFSAQNFMRLRWRRRQLRHHVDDSSRYPRSREDWRNFCEKLENEVYGEFRFRRIRTTARNGRLIFSTLSLENVFAVRKLNDNVRRAYGVRQPARFEVIRELLQAIRESIPKHVIRLDIRSFYESIATKALIERLRTDRLVSARTCDLIQQLLRRCNHLGAPGLPRGLQLSATLAELVAASAEASLRRIQGIYYVARYVDDIVLLSTRPWEEIEGTVSSSLSSHSFRLNRSKIVVANVGCRCRTACVHAPSTCPCQHDCTCVPTLVPNRMQSLDILGYKLAFPDTSSKDNRVPCEVRAYLADKKIQKFRLRIRKMTSDYLKNGDFELLRDRALFLTGNHRIPSFKKSGKLRGGLFYNYSLYEPFVTTNLFPKNRLEYLDTILQKALRFALVRKGPPSRRERRRLLAIKFSYSFSKRVMCKFPAQRIKSITSCWKYAKT